MILEVDGYKYKIKKRKAKVGERVLFTFQPLSIRKVEKVYGLTVVDDQGKENFHHDYIVLEDIQDGKGVTLSS